MLERPKRTSRSPSTRSVYLRRLGIVAQKIDNLSIGNGIEG